MESTGLVKFIGHYLARRQVAKIDGRALAKRTQLGRSQRQKASSHIAAHHRRDGQRRELARALARLADLKADVSTGEDRAQPADVEAGYPGSHDPELGALDQHALRLGRHLGGGNHVLVVVRQPDFRDLANLHAVVLDLGLAGLKPLRGVEDDGDLGPFAHDFRHGYPDANNRGDERNDPDHGKPRALLRNGT